MYTVCDITTRKDGDLTSCPIKGGYETGWDLGPGTLCCSACPWTNISSSNRIQRNYKRLKITACLHCWGKL